MDNKIHRPRGRSAVPILIVHYVRPECRSCGWKGTLAGTEGFARSEAEKHSCLDFATDLGATSRRWDPQPADVDGVSFDLRRDEP